MTGIPTSWDSCTATLETTANVSHTVWSPCGKFIAAIFDGGVDIVGVWDSTTLERVSNLRPPTTPVIFTTQSLAFSPDGHLLACAYRPISESNRLVLAHTSQSILTPLHRLNISTPYNIVVWDIQIGMVINNIATWAYGKIVFSWDQRTITLVTRHDFHTYDRLSGEQICEGELQPSADHQLGAQWVHKEYLRFAIISSKTDQELVVSIQELQPTSDTLLHVVKSFLMLPQEGVFTFSPVSFHASFVSHKGVIILDIQGPKVLFQSKEVGGFYPLGGQFSHDGHFFAWGQPGENIYILENTSTGYMARSSLRPRFSWNAFSWSPTSSSILCRGGNIIQLLHPDNCLGAISPNMARYGQYTNHLVVYSADWTHIIIAQYGDGHITVLNPSGTTQRSIDTNLEIETIKIVGDTIFVIDGIRNRLSSWHLITEGQVNSTCSVMRENTALHFHTNGFFALSNNCSWIACAAMEAVFLYDVQTQNVLGDIAIDGRVLHIQFSPDGSQLWFIVGLSEDYKWYRVELDRTKDLCFGNVIVENLGDEWSLDSIFRSPDQYQIIGKRSKWVSDFRGNILWLPINWRKNRGLNTRWDGKFLVLLSGHHPGPIIIEFQP